MFVSPISILCLWPPKQITVPSDYNETFLVARATYNTVTFGLCMVVIGFVTNSKIARFLAFSMAILLCVSLYTVLLFVFKVVRVKYLNRTHSSSGTDLLPAPARPTQVTGTTMMEQRPRTFTASGRKAFIVTSQRRMSSVFKLVN